MFGTCLNEEIINQDFKYVKSLIEEKGMDYWGAGSGQSVLKYEDTDIKSTMYIMMAEGYGFYLEYFNNASYYIPIFGDDYNDVTEIYVGGDPILVPRAFFLDIKNTVTQVKEFFNCGKVANNVKWIKRSEVNWQYGIKSTTIEGDKQKFTSIDELVLANRRRRIKKS